MKYDTSIPQLIKSTEKARLSSKNKEEPNYGELAVSVLLDADDVLNELNTHSALL